LHRGLKPTVQSGLSASKYIMTRHGGYDGRKEKKMTYKYYILLNGLRDSKAAYREYLEKYHSLFKNMPEKMKTQHVNATYMYRFSIQF